MSEPTTRQIERTPAAGPEAATGSDRSPGARSWNAGVAPDEILPPGTVVGRFIVHRMLGAGGTGVVYAAHDPELDRTIALKLLRRELTDLGVARARFLREAQALARLSHPNVISVYDVGAAAGCTFIAMEYIHGRTFDAWTATPGVSWSEIVAVLIKAGRGLAAAHAAGIIHRDFKPANLLVGDDGRVVVTDFGLARAANATVTNEQGGQPVEASPGIRSTALAQPLTRTGAIQGTPAYMAPEQEQGLAADARADQFSFCVTLYEAVFGVRPFLPRTPSTSPASSSFAATTGAGDPTSSTTVLPEPARVPAIPFAGRGAPAWLQRTILRGLRSRPDDRYPSMDGLLTALNRGATRRRRWARLVMAAAAVVAAGAGIASYAIPGRSAIALCAGAEDKLAGIWSTSSRAEMRSAFAATGVSYAGDSWSRVEPILDAYAGQWAAMHTDACEATRARGEQSELLMDKRMACLDLRRRELDQLTRLLREPDAGVMEHAIQAARGLSSIQDCGDLAALTRTIKPPPDAGAALRVSTARQTLADVRVLNEAGKYDDGLVLIDKLAGQQPTRDYLPLRAELSYWTARLHMSKTEWERARTDLDDAIWAAEASGHDEVAISALAAAVRTQTELDHFKEAHELVRRGEAALLRFAAPAVARSYFRRQVFSLFYKQGRYQEALAPCQEALDIARRELGPNHLDVAQSLNDLGALADRRGDREQALGYSRESLAIHERTLGPDHPAVGLVVSGLGVANYQLGRLDEALSLYRRALAIFERAFGPDSLTATNTLDAMAVVLTDQKRYAEAGEALRRAIAIIDKTLGPQHSRAAAPHINLANVLQFQNDNAGAIEHYQRAAAILEATVGTANSVYAMAVLNICAVEVERNRPREALAACQRGLPALERALGPDSPAMAEALVIVSRAYAANGRRQPAIAALERGIALWPKDRPAREASIADGELSFARTLWEHAPNDRGLARTVAARARNRLRDAGAGHEADRAEADAWLASHRQ